jgi:chromosome segregation protein
VAHDLDALLAGWRRLPAGWSAVTAQGDLADARGLIVLRGRADPPGGAAARAHARRRELAEAVGAIEARLGDAQEAAHTAVERLRTARDGHLAASHALDEGERLQRERRQAHEAAVGQVERTERRLADLEAERARLDTGAPSTADDAVPRGASNELQALQVRADEARRVRDERSRQRDGARERWTATRAVAEEAETRVAGRRRERAVAEARVAQLTAALPERRRAADELAIERTRLADELAAAQTADRAAVDAAAAADGARRTRRAELLELEGAQSGGSARLLELERAAQTAAVEASRRDEALASLSRERELALEGLPESEAPVPADEIDALSDVELDAELRRVRRMLGQIGSVNPFAIEEHRELSTRLEEMSTQESDLRGAIGSTEELIGRLDAEIAQQFDTAFRAIAERFDEFCQLLFAGGTGSLQMADEADGDAPGGIEIVVRPPGKRLQRLAMLSGGERALTGVALLFAMLTVNPVPFCILDEVDAALDEANIGRFADALRKLSESIDFVVITHNRATIEVADTIYGVTMTDAAVSRVLSLRLADLPAEITA